MSLPNSADEAAPSGGIRLPPPPPPPSLEQSTADLEPPMADGPRRRRLAEVLPETSFVDRYRGTEFVAEPEPASTPQVKTRRRPPPWLLILGGVALTVVGVAASVSLMMGSLPRGSLGAFKGMTPEPSQAAKVTASAADVAPPTPVPPPTQAPWLTDPRHPAGLFESTMTAPGLAYHLDLSVTMAAAGKTAQMVEAADVVGPDYAWTLTVTTSTTTVQLQAVRKGLFYYTKIDAQPWVRRASAPSFGVLGNLDATVWSGMQYVGPESVGDRLMHHLRLPIVGWPGAADSMVFEVVQAPTAYVMDVWVDDKGKPATAVVDAQPTLHVAGVDALADMHAQYTFSRFGKRVKIDAPEHFNPG